MSAGHEEKALRSAPKRTIADDAEGGGGVEESGRAKRHERSGKGRTGNVRAGRAVEGATEVGQSDGVDGHPGPFHLWVPDWGTRKRASWFRNVTGHWREIEVWRDDGATDKAYQRRETKRRAAAAAAGAKIADGTMAIEEARRMCRTLSDSRVAKARQPATTRRREQTGRPSSAKPDGKLAAGMQNNISATEQAAWGIEVAGHLAAQQAFELEWAQPRQPPNALVLFGKEDLQRRQREETDAQVDSDRDPVADAVAIGRGIGQRWRALDRQTQEEWLVRARVEAMASCRATLEYSAKMDALLAGYVADVVGVAPLRAEVGRILGRSHMAATCV